MANRRKLFLTHAGELAHLLQRDVGRDGLVAHFARSYADRHGRRGLLSDAARLPELESTIGREALLVMAADIRRLLAQEFPRGPKGAIRPEEAAFLDSFYAEFLASLIRGLRLAPSEAESEAEMFRRDLEIYRRWRDRPGPIAGVRGDESKSPFPDRCALLLDPAMMEHARRAAAEFENQILLHAAGRFRQLGRAAMVTPRAPKPPKKQLPVRAKKSPRRAKTSPSGTRKALRPPSKQTVARRTKAKMVPTPKKKAKHFTGNSSRPKSKSSPQKRSTRR